ncbi:MAG: ATP-dependent RNA helicase HrpA [Spirochaetales bacterium]|nr:ATP-dependent RNA helicase HrpA [Spirochaetales bacterium]
MENSVQDSIKLIEKNITKVRRSDRYRLNGSLNRLKRQKDPQKQEQECSLLLQRINDSIEMKEYRKKNRPRLNYPENLPITARRGEIVQAIRDNQVIILSGQTGSGKTTQIPKFCIEAGRGIEGKIGCTQPRRIAAMTVASRIAEEMGEDLGRSVGYKIRFQDQSSPDAFLKVMTDGILLAETQGDPWLNEYDTLIIDEAHERSLNIDFILGIIRNLLKKRRDLKVVITSATIDTEKFSKAFGNAPIIEVSGRTFPVEVRYREELSTDDGDVPRTYAEQACDALLEIITESSKGDILVFMPTEQDIRETCDLLRKKYQGFDVLPLYARLAADEQKSVFKPSQVRKIIVSTNIAETSITIPGIRYVVDSGVARIAQYSPASGTFSLPITEISRSSADQRTGRCGRMENGICVRLYSEEDYIGRSQYTLPEILRTNLAEVILRMTSLGIKDVTGFPFIDPPARAAVNDGFKTLFELGAVRKGDKKGKGTDWQLTKTGQLMARLPIDPRLAKMLIEANRQGCLEDVLVVASALTIQDPRERPVGKEELADSRQAQFKDRFSDYLTLLNIWKEFHRVQKSGSTGQARRFCKDNYISYKRMREWRDIHKQITMILRENDFHIKNVDFNRVKIDKTEEFTPEYTAVHKAVLSGLLSHLAQKKEKNFYKATKNREVMIFPGSAVFNHGGPWIVASEMVHTSRLFARTVAQIDVEWIEELGKHLCTSTYMAPRWEMKAGDVLATEQVRLYGFVVIPGRTVSYSRVNPSEASDIFVRTALVEGEMDAGKNFSFLQENRKKLEEARSMEEKLRRRNIIVGDEELYQFYRPKLEGIASVAALETRIRKEGDQDLKLSDSDVYVSMPSEEELSQFPDSVTVDGETFKFEYNFDPGSKKDGVTIKVPTGASALIPADKVDWMVPGLYREKVEALIKGLPKEHRKKLVPIGNTVDEIVRDMPKEEMNLPKAISEFLYSSSGIYIPPNEFDEETLPDHLRIRIAITDQKGKELKAGRKKNLLVTEHAEKIGAGPLAKARREWEKSDVRDWDFGDLPETLEIRGQGRVWKVYPALKYRDGMISLRLFESRKEAERENRNGITALYMKEFSKELKNFGKELSLPVELKVVTNYFSGPVQFEKDFWFFVMTGLFGDRRPHNREEFTDGRRETGGRIFPFAEEMFGRIKSILEAYKRCRGIVSSLESRNKYASDLITACLEDLEAVCPADFLHRYSEERLYDLPRYLKAIEIRAERGALDPSKDEERVAKMQSVLNQRKKMLEEMHEGVSAEKKEAVEEFDWLLQEFRVSVFAQQLKTKVKVSQKRLIDRIHEIREML